MGFGGEGDEMNIKWRNIANSGEVKGTIDETESENKK